MEVGVFFLVMSSVLLPVVSSVVMVEAVRLVVSFMVLVSMGLHSAVSVLGCVGNVLLFLLFGVQAQFGAARGFRCSEWCRGLVMGCFCWVGGWSRCGLRAERCFVRGVLSQFTARVAGGGGGRDRRVVGGAPRCAGDGAGEVGKGPVR